MTDGNLYRRIRDNADKMLYWGGPEQELAEDALELLEERDYLEAEVAAWKKAHAQLIRGFANEQ